MKQISDKEYWARLKERRCIRCGAPLSQEMREMTTLLFDERQGIEPIRCDSCASAMQSDGESAKDSYFVL